MGHLLIYFWFCQMEFNALFPLGMCFFGSLHNLGNEGPRVFWKTGLPQFMMASIQVEVLTPVQDCVLCLKQVIFLEPKFWFWQSWCSYLSFWGQLSLSHVVYRFYCPVNARISLCFLKGLPFRVTLVACKNVTCKKCTKRLHNPCWYSLLL